MRSEGTHFNDDSVGYKNPFKNDAWGDTSIPPLNMCLNTTTHIDPLCNILLLVPLWCSCYYYNTLLLYLFSLYDTYVIIKYRYTRIYLQYFFSLVQNEFILILTRINNLPETISVVQCTWQWKSYPTFLQSFYRTWSGPVEYWCSLWYRLSDRRVRPKECRIWGLRTNHVI